MTLSTNLTKPPAASAAFQPVQSLPVPTVAKTHDLEAIQNQARDDVAQVAYYGITGTLLLASAGSLVGVALNAASFSPLLVAAGLGCFASGVGILRRGSSFIGTAVAEAVAAQGSEAGEKSRSHLSGVFDVAKFVGLGAGMVVIAPLFGVALAGAAIAVGLNKAVKAARALTDARTPLVTAEPEAAPNDAPKWSPERQSGFAAAGDAG